MAENPVVVVGGGMAGIAAALTLIERGESVLLLEKKSTLGGRASSFVDRITGDEIDNGQHVLLGCCTNVIDLLGRLGVDHLMDWSDSFTYIEPGGRRHDFRPSFLPAPLHFAPALLSFGALRFSERLEVIRAFVVLMMASKKKLDVWAQDPILTWLKKYGQSAGTIARFWHPIIVGAVNEGLDVAATTPSLQVFLEGFMPHRFAARLGVAQVSLERLFAKPAHAHILQAGSCVRTHSKVSSIIQKDERLTALRLQDGSTIETSRCIFALPPEALVKIECGEGQEILSKDFLSGFRHAPIAGLHFWFDRACLDLDHAAFLDTELEWVFKKNKPGKKAQLLGAKERIQGVISAAHHLHGRSQQEIIDQALKELRSAIPAYAEAKLIHGLVVRENRATLSLDPRTDSNRPPQTSPVRGCFLAGDWVQTGWPGTLEGAARSGRRAAALVLGISSSQTLTPDLPRSLLARMMMPRIPTPLVVVHDPC